MIQRWQVWGALCAFFAIVAETVNIVADEYHFIQWLLFILAVVTFIFAVTAWDRSRREHRRGR